MDQSVANAFVNEVIEELRWDLGLARWKLDITYGPSQSSRGPDVECLATVKANWDYWWATITIDPAPIDTEEELFRVLRHELLHLVNKPFGNYARMTEHLVRDDVQGIDQALYEQANEELVANLEWMFLHLDLRPEQHLARIREQKQAGDGV